ncbi:hypothetical protein Q2T83_14875 [Fervidibacter sacchari]|uniref:Uncharacterized protein n=1 Tax=Candidatus Fervidibacter sacchari TaxID=1448929 RepID=A0ABT2EIR0_9BACT|nr:hypothetical protein [Candidatus Fervidibacter sacchari]MCS3917781.1 hypothetical protein [Candidatus Fervidibacter sacchari]WKU15604.1 hypothetical protein Q2T83_14875 [Candidatus Fervidibacter sacchari]
MPFTLTKQAVKSFCAASSPEANRWLCDSCSNTSFVARSQTLA